MTDTKPTSIQDLLDFVMKKGTKQRAHDANRTRSGSYITGYRNESTVATLEDKGYILEATQVDWQTYDPSADRNGVRHLLKILKGGKVVFEAQREGASTSKNFGHEERYVGATTKEAGEWIVVSGKIPERLEVADA